ncbi:MAG: C10 family peptidase [Candidatus Symbiothrix sp.]|jgi:hypothetical protein|nr:C10 family peptidase [Candidatus Symbiothrix sp.]
MNKKLFLIVWAFLFSAMLGMAKPRSATEATSVATNFLSEKTVLKSPSTQPPVTLTLAYTAKSTLQSPSEEALFYVFNQGKNRGFIIVSADDRAKGILGYSDEGSFDFNQLPDNFKYWLSFYESELKQLADMPETILLDTEYLNRSSSSVTFANAIAPLVKTKWDQGAPYNNLCPVVSSTRTVTGCVATAMAQVMKYWNYPEYGTGSHSYTSKTRGFNLSADFGNTSYEWDNMTNTYSSSSTDIQNAAVATLMYHCGVSVDMDYNVSSAGGSGANSLAVAAALRNYFSYDAGVNAYTRDFYVYSDWVNIIKTELNANRPVFYSGHGSGGGHAFVCDGYDGDDLFHINWGWGGSSNGYFELSALSPSALGIGGGSGGYNTSQSIIAGIQPPTGSSTVPSIKLGFSSLLASKTTLASPTESFDLTISHLENIGSVAFTGYLGTALCDLDDSIIDYDVAGSLGPLPPGSYYPELGLTGISLPAGLFPGTYKLYLAYSVAPELDKAILIEGKEGSASYLLITVSGTNQVTISEPADILPNLVLEGLSAVGNLYQNKTGQFEAIVTNNGNGEYNSNLVIQLGSQLVANDPVIIPAGETKTIGFSDSIKLAPNTYILSVKYDPNNNRNSFTATEASVLGSTTSIAVQATPTTAPNLILLSGPTFPNSTTQVDKENPQLTARIRNTGGFFEDDVLTFVFSKSGTGGSLTYFGYQTVLIDQNEEKDIVFNTPINLETDDYIVAVFWYNSGWTQLGNALYITLVESPALSNDGSLQSLTVSDGTLTPAFDPATINYTVNVPNSVTTITVTGTANHVNATVNGNGEKTLTVGTNPIAISTIAEDRSTTQTYTVTVKRDPLTATWAGGTSDWNLPANWQEGVVPGSSTDVVIRASAAKFPVLEDGNTYAAKNITIEAGAELGRQDLLTYQKAFVQYNFDNTFRNRWNMVSVPLQEVHSGDFTFGGYPRSYLYTFKTAGKAEWDFVSTNTTKLKAGDAFLIWLDDENIVPDYGLGKSNGILELPFFENASVHANVHHTHEYTAGAGANDKVGTSQFFNFKSNGTGFERTTTHSEVDRTTAAHKLAASPVNEDLLFVQDDDDSFIAMVGNPFMSTIDFDLLHGNNDNATKIKQNYQIMTGEAGGLVGYNPVGSFGSGASETGMDQYIAPMQSFFVEKNTGSGQLIFDLPSISAAATGKGTWKAGENTVDKLNIMASNSTASVLTFIANREEGQDVLGSMDARKLLMEADKIPDIYTLKETGKGSVAVGANIINNDNLLIPIGLFTSYEGKMTFTFNGMDTYHAAIRFMDTRENKEIELTGLPSYEYSFDYVPAFNSRIEVLPADNRFFIQLTPAAPTGLNTLSDKAMIYSKDHTIYAATGSSDVIRQIWIYNTQGTLVYANKKVDAPAYSITRDTNIPEVCIVKLVTDKGVKNAKVRIK